MDDNSTLKPLLPPVVTAIKEEEAAQNPAYRGHMERTVSTTSADIREEGKELKEAAEQSLSVILDLTVDGKIRWASPTWQDIIGIPFDDVQGKPISDLLGDDGSVFEDAIQYMKKDDSCSKNIRFTIKVNRGDGTPKIDVDAATDGTPGDDDGESAVIDLEAQGILVYDRSADEECHTMWMIRPFVQREVTIDLPNILVESLGVGAEMLAQHLTRLADSGAQDPEHNPPPLPVLCRICERQITPWWFPKHTELCMQEHQAEADLQMAQDTLTDHRNAIVKVLDALETLLRHKSQKTLEGDRAGPPAAEYNGMEIGTYSSPSSGHSSGVASPAGVRSDSRDRSSSTVSHNRGRSFAVRRPLARIVELVLDLCDTALEINTPALKESKGEEDCAIRTQSPQSEGRINQVLQWQSPSQGALEHEGGLIALCDDTSRLAKAKVDSVLVYRRMREYTGRIRTELIDLVQECIDAALQKAARIAAGETSSDSESTGQDEPLDGEDEAADISPQRASDGYLPSFDGARTLHENSHTISPSPPPSPHPPILSSLSTRSSSPKGCPTPKSYTGSQVLVGQAHRSSITTETDTGADSDASGTSSIHSRPARARSPNSEVRLSRTGTRHSRERKRSSLVLSRALSSSRQHSPARSSGPASPLRVTKPRFPSGQGPEDVKSPIMSPTLPSSEFHSPVITAQPSNHRRQSSAASSEISRAAVSPRLSMSNILPPRAIPPSIRDFEIIKPISKGAFGSVYLSKKKTTGDYYAIKALKKADMVAKNQVANVKAERAILMWQGESDFVAKLYWTFPSKDYIFLVTEYLNGGDCASLVQALGTLPEDWAKRYMAEVVQGVEHLHSRGIVHRDLKPDNLLIDQKGHLKLTDFGLSRMGLIGRQKRALSKTNTGAPDPLKPGPFQRSVSMASSRSTSFDAQGHHSPGLTPTMTPVVPNDIGQPSYFSLSREGSLSRDHGSRDPTRQSSGHQSDVIDTEQLSSAFRRFSLYEDVWSEARSSPKDEEDGGDGYPLHSTVSSSSNPKVSTPPQSTSMPPPPMALFDPEDSNRRFVGTPDYLAPETINGLGQDEMSDWWSIGCILFEFLFGYPPFHAETPEKVFDNISNRRIDWPPEEVLLEVSHDVKDFMNSLMSLDPSTRLGANIGERYSGGGEEIKKHQWFVDVDWENLNEAEPSFVPAPENIEDTEYFDARGATPQDFATEFEDQNTQAATPPGAVFERPYDALSKVRTQANSMKRGLMPLHIPLHVRDNRSRRSSEPLGSDDFGQFSFKNLPVLEKANKDVIQKLRNEAMQAQSRSAQTGGTPLSAVNPTPPSLEGSPVLAAPIRRALSTSKGGHRSASPSSNISNPSPSRVSQPSSPLVQFSAGGLHERRKTSSGSSSISRQSGSLSSGGFFEARIPHSAKTAPSNSSSPVKAAKTPGPELDTLSAPGNATSPRTRSHTVGSNESRDYIKEGLSNHHKRRSQVIDVSPSSSDTEDPRQKALLRVHRRRQSSRRMSQISFSEGPIFRPLDVLVCEDHPVSRLVMEKLLEKLRCRAIIVQNGPDAMRYALSSVKFDIIMMEFKLPQMSGADVARMIRDTKNENCHTPIVAVTGYLKELLAPHHFDALIEKPPTKTKLVDVMSKLCSWKEPPPGWSAASQVPAIAPQSALRNESHTADESPTSTSSGFVMIPSTSSYRNSSREDSMSSNSLFTDLECGRGDVAPADKQNQAAWHADITGRIGGLGISDAALSSEPGNIHQEAPRVIPKLIYQESAPSSLDTEIRPHAPAEKADSQHPKHLTADQQEPSGGDFGDDEDEELGHHGARSRSKSPRSKKQPPGSSKLSTEMLRSDSHGSVISTADSVVASSKTNPESPTPSLSNSIIVEEIGEESITSATTPPEVFPPIPGNGEALQHTSATPKDLDGTSRSKTPTPIAPSVAIPESQHFHLELHPPPSDLGKSEESRAAPNISVSLAGDQETTINSFSTPPRPIGHLESTETSVQAGSASTEYISSSEQATTRTKEEFLSATTPQKSLESNDPDPTPRATF